MLTQGETLSKVQPTVVLKTAVVSQFVGNVYICCFTRNLHISAVTDFHLEQFPVLSSEVVFLPSSSIILYLKVAVTLLGSQRTRSVNLGLVCDPQRFPL